MTGLTITHNEKPAEVLIPGGLNRVLSTMLSPPPQKDEDDDLVLDQDGRV